MMPDNLIIIKGGAYSDVKKALKQWINLYTKQLQDDFVFKLYKNGRGNHIIQADQRLDNDLFYYLVNYLNYPEGIDYKIDIEGFTVGKENNALRDKKLLVYVSPTDKDGDNVFVTTLENGNFKIDFGGRIIETSERKIFEQPVDLTFENPEILKIDKREVKQKRDDEISLGRNGKRFNIISIILAILFLSTYFIRFVWQDEELFLVSTMIFCAVIWAWFWGDYPMLRETKFYLRCLGIAVLCGIYGVFLDNQYGDEARLPLTFFGIVPLMLLVIQKPARQIYLKLFKREPIIDNYGKIVDMIYTMTLALGSIILSVLIVKIT